MDKLHLNLRKLQIPFVVLRNIYANDVVFSVIDFFKKTIIKINLSDALETNPKYLKWQSSIYFWLNILTFG